MPRDLGIAFIIRSCLHFCSCVSVVVFLFLFVFSFCFLFVWFFCGGVLVGLF